MIRPALHALALLALTAGQAAALTCAPSDAVRSYTNARDSEDAYVVLLGRFSFDPSLLPESEVGAGERTPVPIPARFTGTQLDASGDFATPVERDVTLLPICFGPWCGAMQAGEEVLAFGRLDGDEVTLELNACNGWHLPQPDAQTLSRVRACHRGAACVVK